MVIQKQCKMISIKKNVELSDKQRLLVKASETTPSSCHGYLNVEIGESFLLIDDICGNEDQNTLLVINKRGCVGYISSQDVEFIVAEEAETEPFLESLIKHPFRNERIREQNKKNFNTSPVEKQEKDIIQKFLVLLEALKHLEPSFNINMVLRDLLQMMNEKVFGHKFQTLGSIPFRELAMHYLKDAFSKTGADILKLLKVMCKYNSYVSESLVESDFPTILMMDAVYRRYDAEQLNTSLEILKFILEDNSQDFPPQILDIIRSRFLTWLIKEMDCSSEGLWQTAASLLITIYRIPSLTAAVVAKILAVPRTHLPKLLVLLATKNGIRSTYWQLLVDLLVVEGNEFNFSRHCVKDLVELVWCKQNVMMQNSETYLKILETLCCLPTSKTFPFKKKIVECLKISYKVFPEFQNVIWALFNKISVDNQEKIAVKTKVEASYDCSTMYIPTKLKAILGKLEHMLGFLSVFREDPSAISHLEILPILDQCHKLITSLELACMYKDKLQHYVYNLNPIHNGLDIIDDLFIKFCTFDVQSRVVLILSETCSYFPYVVTHALQLKMVPTLLKQTTYFSNRDPEFFEILIITFTRLLCNNREPLPTGVSECLLGEFIVFLIEITEKRSLSRRLENIVSFLLAINLYKTEEVVKAFTKTCCNQTIQIVKFFLKRGFDPLCGYDTTLEVFSPMKMYSDLLDNAQTIILLKHDNLRSVLEFGIDYLELVLSDSRIPCTKIEFASSEDLHHVPESLRFYLQKILRNSLRHFMLMKSEIGIVKEGEKTFAERPLHSRKALNVLYGVRKVFDRKWRTQEFLQRSESFVNFSLPDVNPHYYIRNTTSTHCIGIDPNKSNYKIKKRN